MDTNLAFCGLMHLLYFGMLWKKPSLGQISPTFLLFYNAVQILLSLCVVYGTWQYVFWERDAVETLASTVYPYLFLHYLNKYVDFVDTWVILKKGDYKRLSVLHVFHHGTVGLLWYAYLTVPYYSKGMCIGAAVNSLIHILMYSYYTAAAYKVKVPNSVKFLVTKLQMLQFVFFMYNIYSNGLNNTLDYISLAYTLTLLLMFANFYVQNNGVVPTKVRLPIPAESKE